MLLRGLDVGWSLGDAFGMSDILAEGDFIFLQGTILFTGENTLVLGLLV